MTRRVAFLLTIAALLAGSACDKSPSDAPLILAARSGSLETIGRLLDAGADVNQAAPTGDGWDATPLQHAILARQAGAVRLLLERGADPNTTSDSIEGSVPIPALTLATRGANMPIALALQQRGAAIRVAASTLLTHTPQPPWADVFKEYFARPDIREQMQARFKETRAAYGGTSGFPDVRWMHELRAPRGRSFVPDVWTALLDRGYDAAGRGDDGSTLLHRAARTGQIDLLRLVLSRGVDPNLLDVDGRPPIAIAIRSGESDAIDALRQAGADESRVTAIDRFIGACVRSDLAEAHALATANRRLTQRLRPDDYELFVRAAGAGESDQVSTMLAAGINPNGLGEAGATPLHAAAWSARVDVAHRLLDAGARRDRRDATYGETPTEWAIQGSSEGRDAPEDYAAVMAALGADGHV